MTNSSGFGQTEQEKVKTASNLASTSNNLRTSAAAQEYLTGIELRDEGRGTGSITSETDDLKTTYLPDQSFGDQALLQEVTNKQNKALNLFSRNLLKQIFKKWFPCNWHHRLG